MARTANEVFFKTLAEFPTVGSANQIYIDTATQKAYLWDGATYVTISGGGGGASVYNGTGVVNGLTITANADTTKIDIAAGVATIVDNTTTPGTPIVTPITYAGATGILVTNIAAANTSYISLNSSGVVVQRITQLTSDQRRDEVFLGIIVHSNRVAINAINNEPEVIISDINQFYDLLDALKGFNEYGNVFSANGANLKINKSLGSIFKRGINFLTDPKDPHTKNLASATAATFRYRLRDGTEYADTTDVDAAYWDNAGVRTLVTGSQYTIQRINVFPSGAIRIQYGQTQYTSLALAQQAVSDAYVTEGNIAANGLLRCLLIVQGIATDLTVTSKAKFLETNRFGDVQSAASSGGVTTMQQSYDNSSAPQITTSTTLGAIQFKRGSAADTDNVFQILNGAGTANYSINGNGAITQSGATGTLQALTMSNSYAASGIGQSITIGDTQTQALTGLKIELGTSAQGHIGLLINAQGASASQRGIKIDLGGTQNVVGMEIANAGTGSALIMNNNNLFDVITFLKTPVTAGNANFFNAVSDYPLAFGIGAGNRTSDYAIIDFKRRVNTASTSTDDFNVSYIKRTNLTAVASSVMNAAGSVLKLENVATQTAGTLTDTVDVLRLVQSAISTGNIFQGYQGATSVAILDKNGNYVFPKTAGVGHKVDTTTPTFAWRDIIGAIIPKTAANSPTYGTFQGNINGYKFIAGDIVDFVFHLPHDYVPGTDIHFHVHWTHNGTAITGNAVFTHYATYAKGFNQAVYPAEVTNTITYNTVDITTTPQYIARVDEVQLSTAGGSASTLNTTNLEPDGLVLLRLVLTTLPTITAGNLFISTCDIHYQSTSLGTKAKAPNFYV